MESYALGAALCRKGEPPPEVLAGPVGAHTVPSASCWAKLSAAWEKTPSVVPRALPVHSQRQLN